jgi:hypothetical protein
MASRRRCRFLKQVPRFRYMSTTDQFRISQDEFEMNMRLLGAPTLKDVVPSMVDASNVHTHIVSVPGDNLYNNNCKAPSPLLCSV